MIIIIINKKKTSVFVRLVEYQQEAGVWMNVGVVENRFLHFSQDETFKTNVARHNKPMSLLGSFVSVTGVIKKCT